MTDRYRQAVDDVNRMRDDGTIAPKLADTEQAGAQAGGVEALISYLLGCVETHASKFPVPAHMLSTVARIREALASSEAARLELVRERDEARGLVIEANNSLYGSQGYFHSLNGGAYDKYHLARGIEAAKAYGRKEWQHAEAAEARALAAETALAAREVTTDAAATITAQAQEIERLRNGFGEIDSHALMLRRAIEEGDPEKELLLRVNDLLDAARGRAAIRKETT